MCGSKALPLGSRTEVSLSALRENPLWQRRFGERQSGRAVVIHSRVLGVDRVSAHFRRAAIRLRDEGTGTTSSASPWKSHNAVSIDPVPSSGETPPQQITAAAKKFGRFPSMSHTPAPPMEFSAT